MVEKEENSLVAELGTLSSEKFIEEFLVEEADKKKDPDPAEKLENEDDLSKKAPIVNEADKKAATEALSGEKVLVNPYSLISPPKIKQKKKQML